MWDFAALHSLDKNVANWTYGVVQTVLSDFWTGTLKKYT